MAEGADAFVEALWDAEKAFGPRLSASDQVAIARSLAMKPIHQVSTVDVQEAFEALGLKRPLKSYAETVLSRANALSIRSSLLTTLLEYRRFAIRSLSRQFGGKIQGEEDKLRDSLLTFLPQRGYAEAHSGRGRTDILLPAPADCVIEVKVWTSRSVYEDGLEELGRYIHTERPKQAYMVVFCNREPLPPIAASHEEEIAEQRSLERLVVPIILVPFEVDAPSKAARNSRRRRRNGR